MLDLLGADVADLERFTNELGLPRFRAQQIFHWVHRKGAVAFSEMRNIPVKLAEILSQKAFVTRPELVTTSKSKKGDTIKFLLKFSDDVLVETVLMIYEREESRDRNTVCVSTQAGCAMGCAFCATGLSGMERNLSTGEIIAQVWAAERYCQENNLAKVTNVVYMGMGEPLANLPPVLKSIHLLHHHQGLDIGLRRITLSTCGLVPKIYELAEKKIPITLAVSLHAPDNELRNRLMPINKKYPLEEVLKAADYYAEKTGRRVTYEYALFRGVNDREEHGAKLGRIMQGRLAHINIIPSNEVPESGFLSPGPEDVARFIKTLTAYGVGVVVREEKGGDINAACGQLRRKMKDF
ncbi:MAG: 23S rRNA (adenine(2503)-C(2))-methyltransferase RlmN [Dehalobacterium sp.]|jgi:23S rRNA (adenine2503-C2)-methyltransferase